MKNFIIDNFNWYKDKFKKDCIDAYATQAAFFIIIAFIPFVLLLLSILSFANIEGTNIMEFILGIFPEEVEEFLANVLLLEYKPVALFTIAGFTCLWSSSKATLALIKGLNSVFETQDNRNYFYLRGLSLVYTLSFAVIIALTAVLLVFGNLLYDVLKKYISPDFMTGIIGNKSLWGFIVLAVFFSCTYKCIPYKVKTPIKYCIVGASFSAAGWILFSDLFSLFVENFSNYSNMYGSLTALIVVMLWLYFCMYIVLIGGEISVWFYKKQPIKIIRKK